jgi:hypothetical protein
VKTTAPEVKAWLVSELRRRLADLEVPVYRGWPDEARGEQFVVVTKVRADQEWRSLGSRRRDETYRVGVVFQVGDQLGDLERASERAYELLGVLEDFLLADPTLGGRVTVAELEEWEDDELPDARGCVVLVGASVQVRARTGGRT